MLFRQLPTARKRYTVTNNLHTHLKSHDGIQLVEENKEVERLRKPLIRPCISSTKWSTKVLTTAPCYKGLSDKLTMYEVYPRLSKMSSFVSRPTNESPNTTSNKHKQHMTACSHLGYWPSWALQLHIIWMHVKAKECSTSAARNPSSHEIRALTADSALALILWSVSRERANKTHIIT